MRALALALVVLGWLASAGWAWAQTNVALQANGGVASASSTYSGNYPAAAANNGDRKGLNWGGGGGWSDNTPDAWPDWVQIDFRGTQTIREIDVFSMQDNVSAPAEPTPTMTFTQYGLVDFQVQYWNGTAWADVPGGKVTGNNLVWRKFTFPPITTDRIRVLSNGGNYTLSSLIELEAWSVPPLNVALQANGGVAIASSTYSAYYPTSATINGDRKGLNWGAGGGWSDSTPNAWPDWVQVNFSGMRTIGEIDVFSMQDDYTAPAEPTPTMTFTQYGLVDFQVQYWNGTAWADVPGGNVTGNNLVWRKFTFPPITTERIRVLSNGGNYALSSLIELEAWSVPPTNVALEANGALASASSTFSGNYPAAAANNGDRNGLNWGAGGGWSDSTVDAWPDWLQIDFGGTRTIGEIDVFSMQDNYTAPAEPTPTMTFTQYGLVDFQVQYWNGKDWIDVPGGNVSGNNLVWRKFTFPPITTDRIRVLSNGGNYILSSLIELEAWSVPPSTALTAYYIHTDHLNTPRVITNTAGQAVWTWDNLDPFAANGPNENPGGLGTFTCNLRLPGQYFDLETDLYYNYFRDYEPGIGRYIQADPIGLEGGISLYGYVAQNPLSKTDRFGLQSDVFGDRAPRLLPGFPDLRPEIARRLTRLVNQLYCPQEQNKKKCKLLFQQKAPKHPWVPVGKVRCAYECDTDMGKQVVVRLIEADSCPDEIDWVPGGVQ